MLGAVLLLGGALVLSQAANAALVSFSFTNEDGAVAGTVRGTITLPDGDGTFAATSVVVDSAPVATAYAIGFDFTSVAAPENSFTVVGGVLDFASSAFIGLFNGNTAMSLHGSFEGGSSFLDLENAEDSGATGVRDSDSSTLTFDVASSAIPVPGTLVLLALGAAVGIANAARRNHLGRSA